MYVYFQSGPVVRLLRVGTQIAFPVRIFSWSEVYFRDPLDVMHVPVQVAREPEERSSIDCTSLQLPHLLPTRLTEPYCLSDTSNHSTNNEVANR